MIKITDEITFPGGENLYKIFYEFFNSAMRDAWKEGLDIHRSAKDWRIGIPMIVQQFLVESMIRTPFTLLPPVNIYERWYFQGIEVVPTPEMKFILWNVNYPLYKKGFYTADIKLIQNESSPS